MTSQVNPNNVDGTYPVAGQDNDSQGFRDNFTNIRNNLTFAKAELEDLQNKAVLKSALNNTTLSNDLAGNAIVNGALTSWRETYNNVGLVGANPNINFANGNYQKITLGVATTLAFTFPPNSSGQQAKIALWVSVSDPADTLELPIEVIYGHENIQGIVNRVITFPTSGNYFLEFSTVDSGTSILVRDLTRNYAPKYAHHTVANAAVISVNTSVKTYHIDSGNSVIRSNVLVVLPNSAPDGQEVTLSFHTPVTECWITNVALDTDAVKWVANNVAASGNVSVDLVYSTTVGDGRWLRS